MNKIVELVKHDEIELINNGPGALKAILEAIENSKFKIVINMYYLNPDDQTGKEIILYLQEAMLRGVLVYLCIDSIGSKKFVQIAQALKHTNLKFTNFNPVEILGIFKANRRLHQKFIIFDERTCITGGMNLADDYLIQAKGSWLDFMIKFNGYFPDSLLKIINSYHNHRIFRDINSPSKDLVLNDIDFYIQDFWKANRSISKFYRARIKNAKKEITILTAYFFPGKSFLRLLKKASKRGVKVTIILGETSDQAFIVWLTEYLYDELLRYGIKICLWSKSPIHAKAAIIDNCCTIGSYNLDEMSRLSNIEINCVIRNINFQEKLKSELEKISSESTVYTKSSDWKKRYHLVYRLRGFFALLVYKVLFFISTSFFIKK
jgi:cardiolipin synthase